MNEALVKSKLTKAILLGAYIADNNVYIRYFKSTYSSVRCADPLPPPLAPTSPPKWRRIKKNKGSTEWNENCEQFWELYHLLGIEKYKTINSTNTNSVDWLQCIFWFRCTSCVSRSIHVALPIEYKKHYLFIPNSNEKKFLLYWYYGMLFAGRLLAAFLSSLSQ